jgi:uncharacterized damage-inducible protein DinB
MIPDLQTIQFLWKYMVHADKEVLAASQSVPDEGFRREQNISFGSVEKLLNHCMLAQACWLERLAGKDVVFVDHPPLPRGEFPARWTQVHQELLAFAEAQTPESLETMLRLTTRAGKKLQLPIWASMLHIVDHATYHRGQLNSMIKLAGGTPSPIMLSLFCVAEGIGK